MGLVKEQYVNARRKVNLPPISKWPTTNLKMIIFNVGCLALMGTLLQMLFDVPHYPLLPHKASCF